MTVEEQAKLSKRDEKDLGKQEMKDLLEQISNARQAGELEKILDQQTNEFQRAMGEK
jgi:hypothetical protein